MDKLIPVLIVCLMALIIGIIATLGYNPDKPNVWDDNLIVIKEYPDDSILFQSVNGNCYFKFRDFYQGSISLVKCEDFGVINEKLSTM